jgi:hypothetical protein
VVLCSCAICLRSGIEGLDGIAALGGLRELFLSHNRVADTTPLAMHDHLEVRSLSTTFILLHICIPRSCIHFMGLVETGYMRFRISDG